MEEQQKKQLQILGALGVVFLIVFIGIDPLGLRSGAPSAPPPPEPAAGVTPGDPSGAPDPMAPTPGSGDPMQAAAPPTGAPPTAAPAVPGAVPKPAGGLPPSLPARPDPMAPLNPPLTLATARAPWTGTSLAGLPGLSYSAVVPRISAPPRFPSIEGAKPPTVEARDMRLSGVLLNGSLYVILELGSLTTDPRGYVVKPGDEVEGIKVLKIERFRENDRMVTRALVRLPDREERYVYLREGAPPDPTLGQGQDPSGGGMGGPGGPPGGAGGFPGGAGASGSE